VRDRPGGALGGGGPLSGHHADPLQEILLAGAAPVPHRLGVAVTAVAADTDRVWVGFSDGTSGDYDLVVGADGIHRPV
jgi:2-polyprenyl-6-methoxyphenol hydroxylase-like FAD-dependent oxidoreductase